MDVFELLDHLSASIRLLDDVVWVPVTVPYLDDVLSPYSPDEVV